MRLAVIGVGLIGGSFALALREAGKVSHVVGAGRSRANLELARERHIIDAIAPDAAAAAREADMVLVAAPVAQFPQLFAAIAPSIAQHTVLTDAGSTKRDVIAAARNALGAKIAQFVPAHPVAGAEESGAAAASGMIQSWLDSLRNTRWMIGPSTRCAPVAASMKRKRPSASKTPSSRGTGRSVRRSNLAPSHCSNPLVSPKNEVLP